MPKGVEAKREGEIHPQNYIFYDPLVGIILMLSKCYNVRINGPKKFVICVIGHPWSISSDAYQVAE